MQTTTIGVAALLALSAVSFPADPSCSVEVKLRLVPTQAKKAAQALKDDKPKIGKVLLYDTPSLTLLDQGVILRVRSGNEQDLTVKLRPADPGPLNKMLEKTPGSPSCEADILSNGSSQRSFGEKKEPFTKEAPTSGQAFQSELDPAQVNLLKVGKSNVPWEKVRRFGPVSVTEWSSKKQAGFGKITVEQWNWPGGELLEISTKTDEAGAANTEKGLRGWVANNQLTLDADNRGKVATYLRSAPKN